MRGLIGNRGSAVLVSVAVIPTEHSTGMILTAMPSYEDIVRLQNRGGCAFVRVVASIAPAKKVWHRRFLRSSLGSFSVGTFPSRNSVGTQSNCLGLCFLVSVVVIATEHSTSNML